MDTLNLFNKQQLILQKSLKPLNVDNCTVDNFGGFCTSTKIDE